MLIVACLSVIMYVAKNYGSVVGGVAWLSDQSSKTSGSGKRQTDWWGDLKFLHCPLHLSRASRLEQKRSLLCELDYRYDCKDNS